ncbi:MAG: 3-deoxy-7-phosphoheptulonate synthase, partial [Candidatus Micrarchaeota archaeon]|nr:3-deoxy-7-phosphoheptulonate synthase [Candidatus Micrarchaeota archaeon]
MESLKKYRIFGNGYSPKFLDYVSKQFAIDQNSFRLASRRLHPRNTIVKIGAVPFGDSKVFPVIAGPCGLDTKENAIKIANLLKKSGASVFRGFLWKGRTDAYTFQGVGEKGLGWLEEIKNRTGLPIDIEILNEQHLDLVKDLVDVVQIGSRNMQNYSLLKAVGRTNIPVILKNSPGSGLDELLCAAEYILKGGNRNVILCLRGTKPLTGSFSRFSLDMCAFPILKQLTHLPIIGDPTQSANNATIIPNVAMSIAASGADGLLVEVHTNPKEALTDKKQLLDYNQFRQTSIYLNKLIKIYGKKLSK